MLKVTIILDSMKEKLEPRIDFKKCDYNAFKRPLLFINSEIFNSYSANVEKLENANGSILHQERQ